MSGIVRGVAVVVLLACPLTASANWWRSGARGVTAYYYPAPVLYSAPIIVPVVPCPVVVPPPAPVFQAPLVPVPTPSPRPLAIPTPAPPSSGPVVPSTPTTPPMNPVPAVGESRSFYQAAAALTDPLNPPAGAKARVGFWNLTGRDVVLRVDGQTYTVGAGQSLKLELGRTFVWKVDQYEAQVEQMPAAVPSMELVIRR